MSRNDSCVGLRRTELSVKPRPTHVLLSNPHKSFSVDNLKVVAARERFMVLEISVSDVERAIDRSNSQAVSIDNLLQCFIRTAFPAIGAHLCSLFNE